MSSRLPANTFPHQPHLITRYAHRLSIFGQLKERRNVGYLSSNNADPVSAKAARLRHPRKCPSVGA